MATKIQHIASTDRPDMHDGRYFKMQIKGWTNFDPTGQPLSDVVASIERGAGIVTVVEVTQVANNIAEVNDPEVRELFEDMLAVDRIIQKINALPEALKRKLHSAISNETPGQRQNLVRS